MRNIRSWLVWIPASAVALVAAGLLAQETSDPVESDGSAESSDEGEAIGSGLQAIEPAEGGTLVPDEDMRAELALEEEARLEAIDALDMREDAWDNFEWYGEELYFDIEIWGARAARSVLQIGYPEEHDDYGWVIPIAGLATSDGFFGTVYPMTDSGLTYVDPADMLPYWTEKILDERDSRRQYIVEYDREAFRGECFRDRDGSEREYRRWLPSDVHDLFSWIMELRSEPLEVGDEYVYYVFDGWKLSRLTAEVVEHNALMTGVGYLDVAEIEFIREVLNSDQALPFADSIVNLPPVYQVTDGPIAIGRGWIGTDDRRLPAGVEVEAPAPLGAIRVVLDDWTPPDPDFEPDPAIRGE